MKTKSSLLSLKGREVIYSLSLSNADLVIITVSTLLPFLMTFISLFRKSISLTFKLASSLTRIPLFKNSVNIARSRALSRKKNVFPCFDKVFSYSNSTYCKNSSS